MPDGPRTMELANDDPLKIELLLAVRSGDVDLIRRLLAGGCDLERDELT